ncbi:MAG: hypothetical protein AB4372_40235 [Xenococcus sp. (in: cyanobacteria)]
MLKTLQSITVSNNLNNLENKLSNKKLKELVNPRPPRPRLLSDIVQWPEKRTEMLAEYANRELQFGNYGEIRQKATFSSFYLPAANSKYSIWKVLDGDKPRSKYFHHLLTQEREALERHASVKGCKLIISPININIKHPAGIEAVKKRFEQVLFFLENLSEEIGSDKVQVVLSSTARKSHLTIVGDLFFAESQIPDSEGYRQTMFNFHAPTVYQKILQFDDEFERIQRTSESKDDYKNAINKMRTIIDELGNSQD